MSFLPGCAAAIRAPYRNQCIALLRASPSALVFFRGEPNGRRWRNGDSSWLVSQRGHLCPASRRSASSEVSSSGAGRCFFFPFKMIFDLETHSCWWTHRVPFFHQLTGCGCRSCSRPDSGSSSEAPQFQSRRYENHSAVWQWNPSCAVTAGNRSPWRDSFCG